MKVKGVYKNGSNWGTRIWKDGKKISLGTYKTLEEAEDVILSKRIETGILGNHGMSNTPIHNCWKNMVARCSRESHPQYCNYGARGIEVCGDWLSFRNFYKDMGDFPNGELSIDRIDNNGNYEQGNCRWATRSQQTLNQRLRKDNKTGLKGVFYDKKYGKYLAYISVNKKLKRLYNGALFFEACCARKSAELNYY